VQNPVPSNINNNDNNHDNAYGAVTMTSYCKSSPVHLMNADQIPGQPTWTASLST